MLDKCLKLYKVVSISQGLTTLTANLVTYIAYYANIKSKPLPLSNKIEPNDRNMYSG